MVKPRWAWHDGCNARAYIYKGKCEGWKKSATQGLTKDVTQPIVISSHTEEAIGQTGQGSPGMRAEVVTTVTQKSLKLKANPADKIYMTDTKVATNPETT